VYFNTTSDTYEYSGMSTREEYHVITANQIEEFVLACLPTEAILLDSREVPWRFSQTFKDSYNSNTPPAVIHERLNEMMVSTLRIRMDIGRRGEFDAGFALCLLAIAWYNATKLAMTLMMKEFAHNWIDGTQPAEEINMVTELYTIRSNIGVSRSGVPRNPYAGLQNPYLNSGNEEMVAWYHDEQERVFANSPKHYLQAMREVIAEAARMIYKFPSDGVVNASNNIAQLRSRIPSFTFDGNPELDGDMDFDGELTFVDPVLLPGARNGMRHMLDLLTLTH
jgi:hypothetical protein